MTHKSNIALSFYIGYTLDNKLKTFVALFRFEFLLKIEETLKGVLNVRSTYKASARDIFNEGLTY